MIRCNEFVAKLEIMLFIPKPNTRCNKEKTIEFQVIAFEFYWYSFVDMDNVS